MSQPPTRMQWRGFRSMSWWAKLAWAAVVVFAVGLAFVGRIGEGRSGTGLPGDFVQLELGEGVPSELAGGRPAASVPPEVTALVDGPVVSARIIEPADRQGCGSGVAWADAPDVSPLAVLPESMVLTVAGEGQADTLGSTYDASGLAVTDDEPAGESGPMRSLVVVCEFAPDGRLLQEAVGTHDQPGDSFGRGDSRSFMTRQDSRMPGGWEWLLHDRGPYWLAVPAADLEVVRLRWWGQPDDRITSAYSRILLVDTEGSTVKGWAAGEGGIVLGDDWPGPT